MKAIFSAIGIVFWGIGIAMLIGLVILGMLALNLTVVGPFVSAYAEHQESRGEQSDNLGN